MNKRMCVLILGILICGLPAMALDGAAWQGSLGDLADGISQTAYTLSEKAGTAERAAYDTAADRTDRNQRRLAELIGALETPEDLRAALEEIRGFGAKGPLQSHTSGVALKMLKDRANFLQQGDLISEDLQPLSQELTNTEVNRASRPEQLLDRRQRALVMVQVPVAEAVISITDNGEQRRLEAFKAMLKRHECRLLSERTVDKRTNFYVSGKKFVLEAMIRHYQGSEVTSNLKAIMTLTTGGFWGKTTIDVTVAPKPNATETGSLDWYRAILEKDPWKWMAENDYGKLSTLGKVENVAGENKLRLKNAKLQIWVVPANGTVADAIYYNEADFGDVYVAAR